MIDKDKMPKWSPSRIEDVTKEMIDAYFVAKEGEELTFGKKPSAPTSVAAAEAAPPPASAT